MTNPTIEELSIPKEADGTPEAEAFLAAVELANTAERDAVGTGDFLHEPHEVLPEWQHLDKEPKRMFVARVDGRVVGRATMEWRNSSTVAEYSWQSVSVHPDHQSQGIGRALADHLEALARTAGKKYVVGLISSAYGPGPQLEPPTGYGSLARANREVDFLLKRGFTLEQVLRNSRLPLPADPERLRKLREAADAKAGPDYRIVHWADRTPPEWEEQMLIQRQRLWSDIPLAGVPFPGQNDPEIPWTQERITDEENAVLAGGSHQLFGAALHIPTGSFAGYTQLIVPREPDRPVTQGATHVLGEHRGHRLSMLLKIANIQELGNQFPGRPAIVVLNAEDNRFMLDVNEALHFEPVYAAGSWVKQL